MTLQVKKRKDGGVELLEDGKTLAILTKQQARTLADVLTAASRG